MNITLKHILLSAAAATAVALAPTSAFAQDQFAEKVKDEAPEEDTTSLAVSLGGLINGGNTRSWTVNAGFNFHMVRGAHAFGADGQFAYGRASLIEDLGDDTFARRDWDDTTRNAVLGARYDLFLTDMDALFLAGRWRWDTFAGLDTRLQGQIGYLRNLYKVENHRLWGEIGYDLTYDNLAPDPFIDPALSEADRMSLGCADPQTAMPTCYNDEAIVHAARVYLGYNNQLYENIQFSFGTEVLLNLEQPEDVRVNVDVALNASIAKRLQVETKYRLLFDNVPVPNAPGLGERSKADHQFTVSLIYNFI